LEKFKVVSCSAGSENRASHTTLWAASFATAGDEEKKMQKKKVVARKKMIPFLPHFVGSGYLKCRSYGNNLTEMVLYD